MEFENRVALITGASVGSMGAATARGLVAGGASVALVAETNIENGAGPVRDEIRQNGGVAEAYSCDVSDRAAVNAMVAQVRERFGRIDIVVNAAGVFHVTPIMDGDPALVDLMIDVNLKGTYNVIRATMPIMREQGGGTIVNVASNAGILSPTAYSGYSASKAAVIQLTRALVPELKGTGIRVNCIAPGATRTNMTAHVHTPTTPQTEEALKRMHASSFSPYGMPFVDAEVTADVILFLASDRSRSVHGACIVADQGISAARPSIL